ncbi:hypothetical protein ACFP3U_25915 [Kitasatospora misakiensis]|uniref:Uncharacterized protein n=1 Tax=Kitasatospora misakiensis TaxID=67330 RepID=A0ABW0X790_9ACTN
MGSMLSRATEEYRREAAEVFDDLQAVLSVVDIKLPSLTVDWQSAYTTGAVLIDLGAAPPSEIIKLVEALRRGARA